MRPNQRETTACTLCAAPIFFAVTRAGERQALDVVPHAAGSVMAYRGLRFWLARTLPRARPVAAGDQLALGEVAELVDDPREVPPHPLEEAFRPHAQTCTGERRGVQGDLFGVPAPRRPAPTGRRTPPHDLQRKGGRVAQPARAQGEDAQVFDWSTAAPRIAARRRAVRPAAGA